MMGNNDKLIEERTEARAEAFRAQERVRELTEQTNILNAQVTGGRKDKENLEAELRKLRGENRWIPIEERFPKDAGMYLVADEDGLVEQRSFNGHFLRLRNHRMMAWRPLPKPPEVGS